MSDELFLHLAWLLASCVAVTFLNRLFKEEKPPSDGFAEAADHVTMTALVGRAKELFHGPATHDTTCMLYAKYSEIYDLFATLPRGQQVEWLKELDFGPFKGRSLDKPIPLVPFGFEHLHQ